MVSSGLALDTSRKSSSLVISWLKNYPSLLQNNTQKNIACRRSLMLLMRMVAPKNYDAPGKPSNGSYSEESLGSLAYSRQ